MRVDLVDGCSVHGPDGVVAGAALGGRRARVLLTALALSDGPLSAAELADRLWPDGLPPTWQPALRGAVRALRSALAPAGAGEQRVVATSPSGYRLATGVEVDVQLLGRALAQGRELDAGGRHRAALDTLAPVLHVRGERLLPGEDAAWLGAPRAALDALAAEAALVAVSAASGAGDHPRALEIAQGAVSARPLDERGHRALITALVAAGDRGAAVLAYERCRATLAEELGVDPSADTVAAYLEAVAADAPAGAGARVPAEQDSFVGREDESTRLAALLGTPGVVTVLGRGGVGKTRLAARAAAATGWGPRRWVALGSLGADELVLPTVALALGAEADADALVALLAPLGRLLLVLDGAEVARDGVASLVSELVEGCPALTVLVTSRAPLGVAGEQRLHLLPLPVDAQRQLLRERAGAALPDDPATAELVDALCDRCDGLPLALELAAAQLAVMPVGDLVDHLPEVDVADRLRAVVRSSYALLAEDEATVFRRFGVLEGPVGLGLVRAVVAGARVPPFRVVRILCELADRGLLTVERGGARWRYRQDDDLRRFAAELLVAEGQERASYARLAGAIRAMLPDDPRVSPAPFADDVTAVLGSLRSLFAAGVDGRADRDECLELAFRLHRYWAWTAVAEGRFWLAQLLAVAPEGSEWTRFATFALGYLSYFAGDTDEALAQLQAAIDLFGPAPDPYVARALIYVAGLLDDLDRPAEALACVRRAMAAAEPFGTDLYVAAAMGLGSVLSERGDPAAAGFAAEAVARCRADGSTEALAVLLPTAAMVCWQVGALDEARAYVAEARPLHVGAKRIARVVLLSTAAGLALADGDLVTAVEDGAAAEAEAAELGVEREMPLIRSVLARAYLASGDVAAAVGCAGRALETAGAMSIAFPLAICLESAALVGAALGGPDEAIRDVLATAADIRLRGERPPPCTLAPDVVTLAGRVGSHGRPDLDAALRLADTLLGR